MSFTKWFQRPRKRASSEGRSSRNGADVPGAKASQRNLEFDLFAQLSYMSAAATAGISRSELFEQASNLPYASARYFKDVHVLSRKMNTDYAEGCRMVAERAKSASVRSLLLRLAGSLSAGEAEDEFLRREAEIIGETFGNRYERDVESMKKWTDAYVTLLVASGLIVIVAVISMMIYQVGALFIAALSILMVFSTCLGAWIIYASAPRRQRRDCPVPVPACSFWPPRSFESPGRSARPPPPWPSWWVSTWGGCLSWGLPAWPRQES